MKRIYYFCILFMFSLIASAQTKGGEVIRKNKVENNGRTTIQNNTLNTAQTRIIRVIEGITLGSSTKEDIIKQLKNKGRKYDISEDSNNFTVIISNGMIIYQNVAWSAIAYKLFNNIVYQISFLGSGNSAGSAKDVMEYVKLRDYYVSIYGKYHQSMPEGEHFEDKVTLLFIIGAEPHKELSLHFADAKIYQYMIKNVYNM